jgi:hypothetical protein
MSWKGHQGNLGGPSAFQAFKQRKVAKSTCDPTTSERAINLFLSTLLGCEQGPGAQADCKSVA